MRPLDVIDIQDGSDQLGSGHQVRWALDYLVAAYDKDATDRHVSELKDLIKPYILGNGIPDENGNYIWEFDKPVIYDEGTLVTGLMAQRRVSEFVNEDKAWEVVEKYGDDVRYQCVDEIVTHEINLDRMYALNQQGIISDEDMDSILETSETFALVKMKA